MRDAHNSIYRVSQCKLPHQISDKHLRENKRLIRRDAASPLINIG
jgi:hypothetical protein